jgi:hypothetical protein
MENPRVKLLSDLEEAINYVFKREAPDLDDKFRESLVHLFVQEHLNALGDEELAEKFAAPEGTRPLENAIELFNAFLESLNARDVR